MTVEMERLKDLLHEEEVLINDYDVHVIPILHNDTCVILQFDGWALILNDDGTWRTEATDGG